MTSFVSCRAELPLNSYEFPRHLDDATTANVSQNYCPTTIGTDNGRPSQDADPEHTNHDMHSLSTDVFETPCSLDRFIEPHQWSDYTSASDSSIVTLYTSRGRWDRLPDYSSYTSLNHTNENTDSDNFSFLTVSLLIDCNSHNNEITHLLNNLKLEESNCINHSTWIF